MPSLSDDIAANLLLSGLAPADIAVLRPHLEPVSLRLNQRVAHAGRTIRHAYFPCSGMISLVQIFRDSSVTEVGLVGAEGFWGTPLILGALSSPVEAMVQADGNALRLATRDLLAATASKPELQGRFLRYAQFLHVQVSLTAACNNRHPLPQRLARWLLEAHDRLGDGPMPLTHELVSYMLGVRRAGVTDAIKALKGRGLIATGRGEILIADRPGLEARACECYRILKGESRRLLPRSARVSGKVIRVRR